MHEPGEIEGAKGCIGGPFILSDELVEQVLSYNQPGFELVRGAIAHDWSFKVSVIVVFVSPGWIWSMENVMESTKVSVHLQTDLSHTVFIALSYILMKLHIIHGSGS